MTFETNGAEKSSQIDDQVVGTVRYIYSTGSSTGFGTEVKMHCIDASKKLIRKINCECNFQYRAKIPCRHMLADEMNMDRMGQYVTDTSSKQKSYFELVLIENIGTRWLKGSSALRNTRAEDCIGNDSDNTYTHDWEINGDTFFYPFSNVAQEHGPGIDLKLVAKQRRSNVSFSLLMSHCRKFAELCVSSRNHLGQGSVMVEILSELQTRMENDERVNLQENMFHDCRKELQNH